MNSAQPLGEPCVSEAGPRAAGRLTEVFPASCAARRPHRVRAWLVVSACVAIAANAMASLATRLTIGAMGAVSPFALQVRALEVAVIPYYNMLAFPLTTLVVAIYIWPIIAYAWQRADGAAPEAVERRIISTPAAVAALGFVPWVLSIIVFPGLTIVRFGHWSGELMSQQVLSPLVSGFLAAAGTYLLLDWLFRSRIIPLVFPGGRVAEVRGAWHPGVRARLLVFLLAVAFAPLFTMLGLIRAAVSHVAEGIPVADVMAVLAHTGTVTFVVYVLLGIGLTLLVAGTLTRPLVGMVAALQRVRGGDLQTGVQVGSADEVGILEDGVNALVGSLRERAHILETFGRVVEPSIRDRLLSGTLQLGGELRTVSVLFCDLRGFTALAELAQPTEVVATLNQFFGAMTVWVRECEGHVDKFIGDALLVVFGLFDGAAPPAAGAAAALRCALGIRNKLGELNASRHAAGHLPLAVAVSVHTGEVLAGRIGAEDRHEYTVIGDTVNVAARLQQFCKERGHDVLISETTYALARSRGVEIGVTTQDLVTLRGRSEPVRVFGVA